MKIFYSENEKNLRELQGQFSHTAVALGSFDAVHVGHQAILCRAVETAKAEGLTSVVFFFVNQPKEVLCGEKIPYVNTIKRRLAVFEELGVDIAVAQTVTSEFLQISSERFVEEYLKNILDADFLAVGFNYRFGRGGKGDAKLLKDLGEPLGIRVCEVPCVTQGGETVSSTRIRRLLSQGMMEEANACLGRGYTLAGMVVEGNHQGKELGIPTANLEFPEKLLLPQEGVYLTETKVEEIWVPSITNVGGKPSVERNHPGIETHLLDFDKNLYGTEIEVLFHRKIREIVKFSDLEQLKEQLKQDVQSAKEYFGK